MQSEAGNGAQLLETPAKAIPVAPPRKAQKRSRGRLRRSRKWIHVSAPATSAELMNRTRVSPIGGRVHRLALLTPQLRTQMGTLRSAEPDRHDVGK